MEFINFSEVKFHQRDFDLNRVVKSNNYRILTIFGNVSCGGFGFADNDIEGYLEVPNRLLGMGEYFVLTAKGDSMVGAGIDNQDIIIVQKQSFADNGQIAVVMHNGEAVLKRFYKLPNEKKYLLHPENSNYDDIIVDKCNILGIAVKIIKDIQ